MQAAVAYCEGCNKRANLLVGKSRCPTCGIELVPFDLAATPFLEGEALQKSLDQEAKIEELGDPVIGQVLGQYRVLDLVGRGGMARVYKAYHEMLQRTCALKVLNPMLLAQDPSATDLFFNEARSAAALVHPNVVTIHNIGVSEGHHYMEMEYIDGPSLQNYLEENGRVNPLKATNWMRLIAKALAHAHNMGMLHRDIKPANVLLTKELIPKLADFGLAKKVVTIDKTPVKISGTPYYMAPELFRGKRSSKPSDVYAMGVTYYCLLTGKLPFVSATVASLAEKHIDHPVPDLNSIFTNIDPTVCAIVMKCLEKDPQNRYPDADALHEDLAMAFGNLRDTKSLVEEALDGLDLVLTGEGNHFIATVSLPNNRSQCVVIDDHVSKATTNRTLRVSSTAAPLQERYLKRALELNAELPYCTLALKEIDGSPHYIVTHTYPRSACDPEEIRQSVLSVAKWADVVENYLTGEDRF